MSEKQFSMNRYNEDDDPKTIVVEHNKDFSEWYVSGDYMCSYHSSGIGYKGTTPKQKIEILIQEIRNELRDEGFVNVEVMYKTKGVEK